MLLLPVDKRSEGRRGVSERSGRRARLPVVRIPPPPLHTTFAAQTRCDCMRNYAGFSVTRHFFRSPHAASVQALQFGFMLVRTPCSCTTVLLFLTAVRWRPMGKSGANGLFSAQGSSRKWQHPWHACWGSFGSLKGRPKGNTCLIVFAGVRVACKSAPGLV